MYDASLAKCTTYNTYVYDICVDPSTRKQNTTCLQARTQT